MFVAQGGLYIHFSFSFLRFKRDIRQSCLHVFFIHLFTSLTITVPPWLLNQEHKLKMQLKEQWYGLQLTFFDFSNEW